MDTRIGKLNFELGFPTEETTQKVFDEIDYQRAVQAYLVGLSGGFVRVDPDRDQDATSAPISTTSSSPTTSPTQRAVWLTANDTTIYALANVDLGQVGTGRRRDPARRHRRH